MNKLLFLVIIFFAACSRLPSNNQVVERVPATIGSQCNELVGYFMEIPGKFVGNTISKEELLNKNIIEAIDLEILEGPILKEAILKNPSEASKMEVSFLLIKKQYNHFSDEQIIKHYQLLEEFCGM